MWETFGPWEEIEGAGEDDGDGCEEDEEGEVVEGKLHCETRL